MHDAALVGQGHVGAGQHVAGDRLPEDFHAQGIGYDFFGFALEVWVDEGDVVVCGGTSCQSVSPCDVLALLDGG